MKNPVSGNKVNICNVNINNLLFSETLDEICRLITERISCYIVTPNIDHVVKLQKDEEFIRIYDEAALVLADGMPVIWASQLLEVPIKEKISGSDLVLRLCERAQSDRYGIFLMGGRPGSAEKAKEALMRIYPGIKVVGAYCPPHGFESDADEDARICAMIREAKPDILFVGVGAPKQEKWICAHYKKLGVPVSIGVGASIDFIAGAVKRAPLWMQRAGLEWSFRLMQEPGRLWKRYLVGGMKFLWLVLKEKMRR